MRGRRKQWRPRAMQVLWATAVLMIVVSAASAFGGIVWYSRGLSAVVKSGAAGVVWLSGMPPRRTGIRSGFRLERAHLREFQFWPVSGLYDSTRLRSGEIISVAVLPLWLPALAAAVPAALLWRAGRRGPGHCVECGYDLAGNTTGTCPECGNLPS